MSTCEFSTSRSSELSVDALWMRVVDIEKWPQFTSSISSAVIAHGGVLEVAAEVVIKQPGAPESTWTVTELINQKAFTYEMHRAGLVTVAQHAVEASSTGGSVLTLTFSMRGRLAKVWGALMSKKIREFLQLEVEGLTQP